jgi:2-polyprenyl-3-methyl-5-hydroxy-6-metoxy-1,4-benzoquinol methylase
MSGWPVAGVKTNLARKTGRCARSVLAGDRSDEEIDLHVTTRQEWHKFVRRREAEIVSAYFQSKRFHAALELGAGDGTQSLVISRHCDHLICTEVDNESFATLVGTGKQNALPNVEYQMCDAQDLSRYETRSFDLIFSSNVLEHVPDLGRCLLECSRVLADNGLMFHTMPSRWWKAFKLLLAPFKPTIPRVHGVSRNHVSEFHAFGRTAWISKFETNGFRVGDVIGLPFYVGYGNSFISVIKTGNRLRLPASLLYIVEKA